MQISGSHSLATTRKLLDGQLAPSSLREFEEKEDTDLASRCVLSALVELVFAGEEPHRVNAAIRELRGRVDALAKEAIRHALSLPWSSTRLVALSSLEPEEAMECVEQLEELLARDPSRLVRRDALRLLADLPNDHRWSILQAADDPHWRVRKELVTVLLERRERFADEEVARRLGELPTEQQVRVEGVLRYLRYRWSGRTEEPDAPDAVESKLHQLDVWDWDSAVLAFQLEKLTSEQRRELLGTPGTRGSDNAGLMPELCGHEDERVFRQATKIISQFGSVEHFVLAAYWLDEPRSPAANRVRQWLNKLTLDRREEIAKDILAWRFQSLHASPETAAWAIDQVEVAFPASDVGETLLDLGKQVHGGDWSGHPEGILAKAFSRLAERWKNDHLLKYLKAWAIESEPSVQAASIRSLGNRLESLVKKNIQNLFKSSFAEVRLAVLDSKIGLTAQTATMLSQDDDYRVRARLASLLVEQRAESDSTLQRLTNDSHPHVRAAALDDQRAARLVENPTQETSWHVLQQAALITKTPIWKIEPEREADSRGPAITRESEPLVIEHRKEVELRPLGSNKVLVSPMGLSGHYGLPTDGFRQGVEEGVNLLFWEPNYESLTTFSQRLIARQRNELHFIVGTFETHPKRIRTNIDRALRMLRIDQVRFFLLFWVRSWNRLPPEVHECLKSLVDEGKIGTFGLSTHSRPLAVEAIQQGWNPVMVRHSAAHRGAEEAIFPTATEHELGLITFNNTCYGRLLERVEADIEPMSAVDCYRYSLSHDPVSVCMTAPSTIEQLHENLAAMHSPDLTPQQTELITKQGAAVYREDRVFTKLIRSF